MGGVLELFIKKEEKQKGERKKTEFSIKVESNNSLFSSAFYPFKAIEMTTNRPSNPPSAKPLTYPPQTSILLFSF